MTDDSSNLPTPQQNPGNPSDLPPDNIPSLQLPTPPNQPPHFSEPAAALPQHSREEFAPDINLIPQPRHARTRHDPWAHRRGEPRLFAVFWIIYVLISILGGLEWVMRATTISPDSFSPAARIMLIVIAVGAFILWPMTRLSQLRPANSVLRSIIDDISVLIVPTWILIWSLIFSAGWPFDVVAALAFLFAAWFTLIGGILALGLLSTRPRWLYMTTIILLVTIGLAVWHISEELTRTSSTPTPAWLGVTSPLAGPLSLTGHGLSGPQQRVTATQWLTIADTAVFAALLWLLATVRAHRAALPSNKNTTPASAPQSQTELTHQP